MRGAKETRNCAACGRSLTRLVSQARGNYWYCDNRCQASHAPSPITQARTVKLSRVCECGQPFETYPSINQRHCSRRCSARFNPRKPHTGTQAACAQCGVAMYVERALISKKRFCSQACHNVSQRKDPIVRVCPVCGKERLLKPSQSHIQTCSRACQTTLRIKRPLDRLHNGKPARLDQHGYVLVWQPDHPAPAGFKGWVMEHRLVAATILGRPLRSDEQVDHINRDKADNRPGNLQVLDGNSHAAKTQADQRQDRLDLAEYHRRYGPLI